MGPRETTEIRDGMRIDWDVPVVARDGTALRADIYRLPEDGRFPVILSYGPYGKWLLFKDLYVDQWERMCEEHPDVPLGSSNKYQNWEVCDPEKWVPEGYALVRVDSRGAGRSPGILDLWSRQEAEDLYDCIEWAGTQDWSNGRVGLNGISYYAMNQWQAAALEPPHLAAMCAWEGAADYYRDMCWHGGIYCPSRHTWFGSQVLRVQHGRGTRGFRSGINGGWVSGPETLSDEELGAARRDFVAESFTAKLASDPFWTSRMPDWSRISVPLLSAANWGGHGLHPRGNFEGFLRAASGKKWLEVHGLEHWTEFYTDYGVGLQKRFFGYFLKGEDTGWDEQPKVQLQVRHAGGTLVERGESAWPLDRTAWTKLYLHAEGYTLSTEQPNILRRLTYSGLSNGLTFLTPPLEGETEITGPIAAKLFVSSSTQDADLFVVVRAFSPDLKEITFIGALDPHTPLAQGWLRASHRKLDRTLSQPYCPYHIHDEVQPLTPGEIYELDVEVWPTCVVLPKGYRLALSVRGRDYEWPGGLVKGLGTHASTFTGVGPFRHNDARDRPVEVFGGDVTLHMGPDRASHLLLPIIPTY
jgi:predicted acyl esterase